MNQSIYVFAQIFEIVLQNEFLTYIKEYDGDYKIKRFSLWKQFIWIDCSNPVRL